MLEQTQSALGIVLPIAASMWLLHFVNALTNDRIIWAGAIKPRSPLSLINIITAPFLHVDAGHLQANTGAFIVLGILLSVLGQNMFVFVSIALTLATGLILWLFSPNSVIGASGVIFGYLGYLLSFGMTIDQGIPLLAGAIGFVTYGGIWIGIFPSDPRVSWLAHATGFACGLILGHYLGMRAIGLGVYG